MKRLSLVVWEARSGRSQKIGRQEKGEAPHNRPDPGYFFSVPNLFLLCAGHSDQQYCRESRHRGHQHLITSPLRSQGESKQEEMYAGRTEDRGERSV